MGLLENRESTAGRAIEIISTGGDRSAPDAREPISRGASGSSTPQAVSSSDRWVAPLRDPIQPRSFSGMLGSPGDVVTSGGSGSVIETATGTLPVAPVRRYPGSDPFSVLSDLYASMFGGDNAQAGTTQYSVVPQTVGGSGGNAMTILLLLGAAGVGIWYFYFRGEHA